MVSMSRREVRHRAKAATCPERGVRNWHQRMWVVIRSWAHAYAVLGDRYHWSFLPLFPLMPSAAVGSLGQWFNSSAAYRNGGRPASVPAPPQSQAFTVDSQPGNSRFRQKATKGPAERSKTSSKMPIRYLGSAVTQSRPRRID